MKHSAKTHATSLAAVAALAAWACTRSEGREASERPTVTPLMVRATELVGRAVVNSEKRIGDVAEVYLNSRGQIVYYVLESDALYAPARFYAVPAICMLPDAEEERMFLDVSMDRLAELDPFDPEERPWPARASAQWCERAEEEDLPRRPGESSPAPEGSSALAVHPATAWAVGDLLGRDVTTPDAAHLGSIAEVGLDVNAGRVGFWLLASDAGADLVAVPWEALSFFRRPSAEPDGEAFRLVVEATSKQLERAEEFDVDDEQAWLEANTPEWLERQYETFAIPVLFYRRHAVIQRPSTPAPDGGRGR